MKKLDNTFIVILAGGIGSRFWPISREERPKQFIDMLNTGNTLIQDAYKRYSQLVDKENIYVITNANYTSLVQEQLPELSENQILGEPYGKNTAACVAYAAHKLSEVSEDGILIVAPSDHLIMDQEAFRDQIKLAHDYAKMNDALITLGIKPHRPDTGYGYIQYNEKEVSEGVNKVVTFTEKPPIELAEKFLESGDFLWNSGMFIWSIPSILKSLNEHLPEMDMTFQEGKGAYNTPIEKKHVELIYSEISSISIDNGVLEKADNVFVLPSDFGWSDLGTWKSIHDQVINNGSSNTVLNAELNAINSEDNLVVTSKEKLVVIQDLNGYYVIDTEDALLICKTDQEQGIKKISSDVKKIYNGKFS